MFHLNILVYMLLDLNYLTFYQYSHSITCRCSGNNFVMNLPFFSWFCFIFVSLLFTLACLAVVFLGKFIATWVAICVDVWVEAFERWALGMSLLFVFHLIFVLILSTLPLVPPSCVLVCASRTSWKIVVIFSHIIRSAWWRDGWCHLGAAGLAC